MNNICSAYSALGQRPNSKTWVVLIVIQRPWAFTVVTAGKLWIPIEADKQTIRKVEQCQWLWEVCTEIYQN